MSNIQILDCTLRDGGYCNEWRFGFDNAKKIVLGLLDAGVELVECGFLTNKVSYSPDVTRFTDLSEAAKLIPSNRAGSRFVVMMNYGEYDVDDIPEYDGSCVDGIRVAFHKKDMEPALNVCEQIKAKGYRVFIQAMVSLSYTDDEYLSLIRRVNQLKPYAFYIVDSFGMMSSKDLTRLFDMVENNLDDDIHIGFHCHNNLQLAFSNAQLLATRQTDRNLFIDTTIFGMGRGAGNLNTELFLNYLNENTLKGYKLKPILNLIDEIVNQFYMRNYWGYSLPNYISAVHNAHPNYAGYLDDKKTLTIEGINDIFDMMDEDKKVVYDKAYIEELYLRYMSVGVVHEKHRAELKKHLNGKKVVLIAPGKSSVSSRHHIKQFVDAETIIISVNHAYEYIKPDYIFLSNLRRYRELDDLNKKKCIVTSNIRAEDVFLKTEYKDLLNGESVVFDNAGLMAIKFLTGFDVKGIYLAGFDGYSHNAEENYASNDMTLFTKNNVFDAVNEGMKKVLTEYGRIIKLEFLTPSRFAQK
jgi:4-hydroxy 2-oxovalerate aldolase